MPAPAVCSRSRSILANVAWSPNPAVPSGILKSEGITRRGEEYGATFRDGRLMNLGEETLLQAWSLYFARCDQSAASFKDA